MAADDDLARRVERLEDELAIGRLVARYAELCDCGYDPDGLAGLFTEDAAWSAASADGAVDFGRYHGRGEIRAFFASVSSALGPLTLHYAMAPRLELDPDLRAGRGVWSMLAILERAKEGTAERETVLLATTHRHEYRKVDGEWLIARLHAEALLEAPVARFKLTC